TKYLTSAGPRSLGLPPPSLERLEGQVLYIFIILGLERRRLIFANVTTNPTAEWLAQQVVNAFPWDTAPRFLIRDRDRAYGLAFTARVKGLDIREIRTAVRAPRMNEIGRASCRERV